jgi:hypothetical protein
MFKSIENTKYAWLAGWVHKLKTGEALVASRGHQDAEGVFTCTPASFASVVYAMADYRGWKATVVTTTNQVAFSFYKATDYTRPNMPALPIVKKMRGQ